MDGEINWYLLKSFSKVGGNDMLGLRTEHINRDAHFAYAAKRFAGDAKMLRCRAAVHVENKADIVFWKTLLKRFRPNDQFHFISGSQNEYGNETSGVTQCLKYFKFLGPDFFICIDSDYRYLLQQQGIDVKHYVLQTYTYSFENHHCFADGLNDVCERATRLKNTVFDFRKFLKEFSNSLYELFIWHLYFQHSVPVCFSQFDFATYLSLPSSKYIPLVQDNGARVLDELKHRVEWKIDFLGRKYPQANLNEVKEKMLKLGLTPDHVYLFIRGHNLYDLIFLISKSVCKTLLRLEKKNWEVTRSMISELYRSRHSLDHQLRQNIKFGAYLHIQKIEEDVTKLLGNS